MGRRRRTAAADSSRGRRRHRVSLLKRLHLDAKGNFVFCFGDFGKRNEAVDELLSHDLLDDVLVVVIAQRPRQFVVVHVVLVFPQTPQSRHLLGVDQLEFALEGIQI